MTNRLTHRLDRLEATGSNEGIHVVIVDEKGEPLLGQHVPTAGVVVRISVDDARL